jgi:hypothetical protein
MYKYNKVYMFDHWLHTNYVTNDQVLSVYSIV